MKRWNINNDFGNLTVHDNEIINRLLLLRGITSKEQADNFLNPSLDKLHDPYMLKDMDRAIDRIDEAILKRQKIYIYGDFDVDGITSTAILYRAFKRLGVDINFYIPDRINEGYGINKEAIDHIHSLAVDLIITVDCGISAIDEVEYAKEKGLDIIITDHHECKSIIPNTIAINPKRHDCSYPFKGLAGCGVAFKLIQALYNKYGIQGYEELLDLVAIGTVADVVTLSDENRILVTKGLEKLLRTDKVGLKELMKIADIKDKISTYGVAFQIAPRLNAAGRLSDAKIAVELFITSDEEKAAQIAKYLDQENKKRQEIEQNIIDECINKIEREVNLKEDRVIVLSSPNWHVGVVGIVASKIVERFYRPTILLCEEGDKCRGSGRSIEGFNLFENLLNCSDLLLKFGGHDLAAGMTIEKEKINEFRERLNKLAKRIDSSYFVEKVDADLEVNSEDLNLETAELISLLEPFGMGNPQPLFVLKNSKILSKRLIGNDRFLKFVIEKNSQKFDCIDFINQYNLINKQWEVVDILFNLNINEWNNTRNIQLQIKDIKPASVKLIDELNTNYFKLIWQRLKSMVEAELLSDKIIFIENDIEFLKEFAYFKRGNILINDRNSIDELNFLYDTFELIAFNSSNDKSIILFPRLNEMSLKGKEILIYDFLLCTEDYTFLNNCECKVYHFISKEKIERLKKLKNITTFDEKIFIKIINDLRYNEVVNTLNGLAKIYNTNRFALWRLLSTLKNKGFIEISKKEELYKLTLKKDGLIYQIKDSLALNFEKIIYRLEKEIREV